MFGKQAAPLLLLLFVSSVVSWTIEGPSEELPQTQLHSAHEAHLFRQRLLSAFRQVDPTVTDAVLNNFRRYYRNPRQK